MKLAEWKALGDDPKTGFQNQVDSIGKLNSKDQLQLMIDTLNFEGRFKFTIEAIQKRGALRGRATPQEPAEAIAVSALTDIIRDHNIQELYYNWELNDVYECMLNRLVHLKRLEQADVANILKGQLPKPPTRSTSP